jgi:hypothetical protein
MVLKVPAKVINPWDIVGVATFPFPEKEIRASTYSFPEWVHTNHTSPAGKMHHQNPNCEALHMCTAGQQWSVFWSVIHFGLPDSDFLAW